MRLLRSATGRLIAIHLAMVAVSTAAVLAFVYYSTRNVIEAQTQEIVMSDLRGLSDDYREGGVVGLALAIQRRLAADKRHDAVILLADRHGRRVAGNLAGWPPVVPRSGWIELDLYRSDRDKVTNVSVATIPLSGGERLLVGRDSQAASVFKRTLLGALVWALGVSGILGLFSGWFLSRYVGRRVADVVQTAEEIVQGDMARRVPVRGGRDEFDRLAATLNHMLDRIQLLIGDLRMVTDGVAHDLRSPLTRLRTHLEASLEEGLDEATRRERIGRAIAEADGLLRTFAALLEIARAEAGVGRDQFEAVDLGALATDVIDLYTPTAAEKEVALAVRGEGATVAAHPQLLANAVANLVENAIAYSPSGGEVAVELEPGPAPAITVADHGPGVPEEERDRILDRFVRLDASRGRPGAGLGLSLVSAVSRMHGAEFALGDNGPGLRATLRFPAGSAAGPPAIENAPGTSPDSEFIQPPSGGKGALPAFPRGRATAAPGE